ncbi:uncharacterized protein LOC125950420 [Anopheles darlingi]|uniref:uncharacterized protein LOC125950420 n=1 Tax=Anopheles darlingi TaxID=43151 RepID=UPI0021004C4D|nr:uncharacterized protein LOC125950420 [Anopheles darlingi]
MYRIVGLVGWIVLGLVSATPYPELPVSNLPLYNDGIYYEELKMLKLQASTWTLRAEYDMEQFLEELATANRTVGNLLKACAEMQAKGAGNCEGISNIRELMSELNDFSALLMSFCSDEDGRNQQQNHRRSRRGILRSWFGLMDSEDRQNINDNFTRVHQQLDIEASTLKLFYNTTNKALAALSGNLFRVDPAKPHKIDFTREGQLLLMDILLNKIIAKKNLFMELLQSTTSDRLSESIISPNRLLDELRKVERLLPVEFRFPVDLRLREVIKLYPLSKVASYVDGCRLVVNILLPLCNRSVYRTFKGTPVPTLSATNDHLMAVIVLDEDVVAIDETTAMGIVFPYEEYTDCIHLADFVLCNAHQVIRNLNTTDKCVASAYLNRTHHGSDCRVSRIQLNHPLWIQLADPNAWIYVVPNFTDVTILHGTNRVNALTLHGVGMLQLLRMCRVRSKDVVLQYVPQLGGAGTTINSMASNGFSLPVTITRESSLEIGSSSGDVSRIIPAGRLTEHELRDSSKRAGIYREPSATSPWVFVGIACGTFIVILFMNRLIPLVITEMRRRMSSRRERIPQTLDDSGRLASPSDDSVRGSQEQTCSIPTAPPPPYDR